MFRSIESDGCIQGLQLTISHKDDFSVTLANGYIAQSNKIDDNHTRILLVQEKGHCISNIGEFIGDYEITDQVMWIHNVLYLEKRKKKHLGRIFFFFFNTTGSMPLYGYPTNEIPFK